MRTLTQALSLALLILLAACSSSLTEQEIPQDLTTNLMSTYPKADKVEWVKVDENYEAEFEIETVEHTVLMDASGTILRQKHDLTEAEFPESVKSTISERYSGMTADDYEKLMLEGATYYQVDLDNTGKVFSEDGQEQTGIAYWE